MTDYVKSSFIKEDRIKIKDIPAIILSPKEAKKPLPTVMFYHGWSSSKEKQRLRGYILVSMGYQVVIPDAIYHGDSDTSLQIDSELCFYNKLKPLYSELENIKFVEYPKLNHFVTTNMMEESINWLGKYL